MVLEHLFGLAEMISALCILAYLNNEKFTFNIRNIMVLTADIICVTAVNEFQLSAMLTSIMYILLFVYSGMEYGFQVGKMIINMILMVMFVCAGQAGAMGVIVLLSKTGDLSREKYFVINLIVLIFVVMVLKRMQIHRISKFLLEQEGIFFWVLIGLSLLILIYIFSFKINHILNVAEYVIFFMGILYVCLMTIGWKYYKNVALEKSIEMKTTQVYLTAYKNMIEDVRSRQHDFDNHISAIMSQHYICDDYESLVERQKDYIQIVKQSNRYNRLLWSGDSVLVGFLYGKCLEAEKNGIEVDYHMRVSDFQYAIPDYQLIRIIGNLLDNAMEAVGQIEQKVIRFLMEENDNEIRVEIANPYVQMDRNEIAKMFKRKYSRKGENRGYGLYNVKKICDQHGIVLSCKSQEEEGLSWISFQAIIKK